MKFSAGRLLPRLAQLAARYTPETSAAITWVPAEKVRQAARLLAANRPVSMFMHNGVGQHTNATQTSRAIATLYALFGDIDRPGGNVVFPKAPVNAVVRQRISAERNGGATNRPRAKTARPAGQARQLRRLRYFHRDARRPSLSGQSVAQFRFQHDHVHRRFRTSARSVSRGGFRRCCGTVHDADGGALRLRVAGDELSRDGEHGQRLQPSERRENCMCNIVPPWWRRWPNGAPIPGSFSSWPNGWVSPIDFWHGDIEAAYEHELATDRHVFESTQSVRPEESRVAATPRYRNMPRPKTTATPRGFNTPDKKVEIYSHTFAAHGFAPLPEYVEPMISPVSRPDIAADYPLVLTNAKFTTYIHSQLRGLSSLRKASPHPSADIHPETAKPLWHHG